MAGQNLAANVSPSAAGVWDEALGAWRPAGVGLSPAGERPLRVVALDCGAKRNIYRHLAERGWLCVACNYRLSPKAAFPDHIIDVKRSIAWIPKNLNT